MYVAWTGLTTSKNWLDITSDNVANVNTVGFKKERPVFQDLVLQNFLQFNYNNLSLSKTTYGGGVFIASTITDFSQGALQVTNRNTDLAINGSGFFILQSSSGIHYYTRDGQFKLVQGTDEHGKPVVQLVHDTGMKLLGSQIDPTTNQPVGNLSPVVLQQILPPSATQNISVNDGSNLDSNAASIGVDFDPNDATTYNLTYTVQVYDKAGNAYDLGIFFKKLNPLLKDNNGNYYHTFIVQDDAGNKYFTFYDKTNDKYVEAKATALNTVPTDENNLKLITTNVKIYDGTNNIDAVAVYWYKDENNNIHVYAKDANNHWYELSADTNNPTITPNETTAAQVQNVWQTFVLFKDPTSGKWKDLLSAQDKTTDGKTVLTENGYSYDTLFFNTSGTLVSDWNGNQEIALDLTNLPIPLQNALALTKVNLNGLTQYPLTSSLAFQQDGYPPGELQNISIGEDGTITGIYSNGKSLPLYRLKLAYFENSQGLVKDGNNLYRAPANFNPIEQYAGTKSTIKEGALELSNVDISQEMMNMIVAEKAYQANAKVVQTDQTILDTTLTLKR